MPKIDAVAILGCGLIGGSFALALKRNRPHVRIVALDLPERLADIREAQLADRVGSLDEIPDVLPGIALVVLASPMNAIPGLLDAVAPHLRAGTIVTDVGSVKVPVVRKAWSVMPAGVSFIGGHPMAGSETFGVENAAPLLFNEKVFLLCPAADTPSEALLSLIGVVEDLHAVPVTIEAEEHDRLMAGISHVPQLLAVALMHSALATDQAHGMLETVAGRGFLDLTRLAASDYKLWEGILAANRDAVTEALDRLESSLDTVRKAWESGGLEALWRPASDRRQRMSPDAVPRQHRPELRKLIDHFDEQMLKALGNRMRVVKKIGREKVRREQPVFDKDRERQLLSKRAEWARACGLDPDLVESLFALIMEYSKRVQQQQKGPEKTD